MEKKKTTNSKTIKIYMCGVDWEHELGSVKVTAYPSLKSCKANNPCYNECGIVELEVRNPKWMIVQDFNFKSKRSK